MRCQSMPPFRTASIKRNTAPHWLVGAASANISSTFGVSRITSIRFTQNQTALVFLQTKNGLSLCPACLRSVLPDPRQRCWMLSGPACLRNRSKWQPPLAHAGLEEKKRCLALTVWIHPSEATGTSAFNLCLKLFGKEFNRIA